MRPILAAATAASACCQSCCRSDAADADADDSGDAADADAALGVLFCVTLTTAGWLGVTVMLGGLGRLRIASSGTRVPRIRRQAIATEVASDVLRNEKGKKEEGKE